ncbi:methyltransferase domain-containing protein [Rhabdochromatium marinum]|uniref:methyltransferase domain-containing protein n=1 Tax=Rhabdochromatium marinum TaxID=48729 RepID=UPI001908F090|nr:methyltransferase domain-containing protein [Rhabdochromatium marinum]
MAVIDAFFPQWRQAVIHESSPGNRGASVRLRQECTRYIPSQYFPNVETGDSVDGIRCENLEALSFADDSIDLHVTQDVLEHLFSPSQAFCEIARTLKPGGMHICTVPIVNKDRPSVVRARVDKGEVVHVLPAEYHGNPVGDGRSLVTVDWGYDIGRHIFDACGLYTQMVKMDDLSQGIRAEYIEVLVTVKPVETASFQPIP